jgi:predicted nucleic acid-binding protein
MVILDSSFLIAFHNSRDVHHEAAKRGMQELLSGAWGAGLLLEYVFLETVTLVARQLGQEAAARVGSVMLDAAELEFLPCSMVFADAWRVFSSAEGEGLSFTDAAIAYVAREHAGGRVATFDNGIRRLAGITAVG